MNEGFCKFIYILQAIFHISKKLKDNKSYVNYFHGLLYVLVSFSFFKCSYLGLLFTISLFWSFLGIFHVMNA